MIHIRADRSRRLTAVPLAFALAASALLLVSGLALAAKPVPYIGPEKPICEEPMPILDRAEAHGAQFDLSSNKGRWIFVDAELKVGDAGWSSYFSDTPWRVETDLLVMRRTDVGPAESTSFRLRLMDRKGRWQTEWTEVLDVDC